jgi:hypothetical protein
LRRFGSSSQLAESLARPSALKLSDLFGVGRRLHAANRSRKNARFA